MTIMCYNYYEKSYAQRDVNIDNTKLHLWM